jgi:hypothetical protein
MLVQQLLKVTAISHPDHELLESAYLSVKSIADHVNDMKRQEEERTGLFEAYRATENCPAQLVCASRRWIFNLPCFETRTKKDILLMLFSDLLMIAVPIPKSILGKFNGEQQKFKFRFVRMIDLLELEIIDSTDTSNLIIKVEYDAARSSFERETYTMTPSSVPKEFQGCNFTFQFQTLKDFTDFKNVFSNEIKMCLANDRALFEAKKKLKG